MSSPFDPSTFLGEAFDEWGGDPFPDIHSLFQHYNSLYFGDSLGACSVEWSTARMTVRLLPVRLSAGEIAGQPSGRMWLASRRILASFVLPLK